MAAGMDRQEAERRTFLEFGNVAQLEEACRDARGRWLDDLAKDLRYTLRTLRARGAQVDLVSLSHDAREASHVRDLDGIADSVHLAPASYTRAIARASQSRVGTIPEAREASHL